MIVFHPIHKMKYLPFVDLLLIVVIPPHCKTCFSKYLSSVNRIGFFFQLFLNQFYFFSTSSLFHLEYIKYTLKSSYTCLYNSENNVKCCAADRDAWYKHCTKFPVIPNRSHTKCIFFSRLCSTVKTQLRGNRGRIHSFSYFPSALSVSTPCDS